MSIQIDNDVPMPAVSRGERVSKYPFAEMAVGASFFIPGVSANTIHSSVARFMKGPKGEGKTFTVRSKKEATKESNGKEIAGVRVWRVS